MSSVRERKKLSNTQIFAKDVMLRTGGHLSLIQLSLVELKKMPKMSNRNSQYWKCPWNVGWNSWNFAMYIFHKVSTEISVKVSSEISEHYIYICYTPIENWFLTWQSVVTSRLLRNMIRRIEDFVIEGFQENGSSKALYLAKCSTKKIFWSISHLELISGMKLNLLLVKLMWERYHSVHWSEILLRRD